MKCHLRVNYPIKTKDNMNEVLNVLCLEDSPRDAEIIHELLIDAGYNLNMDCTVSEKEYVSLLRSHKYDLILADFKLPGFDGFAALRLSLIHISEPTRLGMISYAVFCLKKKKN